MQAAPDSRKRLPQRVATTGTKLDRVNFTARPPRVSAAAPARLWRDSSPTNRVQQSPSSQAAALLIRFPAASSFIPGVTEPVSPRAREMVISGTTTPDANREMSSAANSTTD